MSTHERPLLWQVMERAYEESRPRPGEIHLRESCCYADEIRAVAVYLEAHGLINTISQPTPRSGPRLLALLEEEARRAEAREQ